MPRLFLDERMVNMSIEKFGELLTNIRKDKGITQEELALRIGVTSQAVSKWERGQSLPDLLLLCGICEVLSINPNTILDIKEKVELRESINEAVDGNVFDNLLADPFMIIFGNNLIPVFIDGIKTNVIAEKRIELAKSFGILVPKIRILDDLRLHNNEYCIVSYGRILYQEELSVIDKSTYDTIVERLFHICVKEYSYILNNQLVKLMVDNLKANYPAIVDGIIPEKISYSYLKKILSGLLDKKISIHNLIKIIEILEEEILIKNNQDINHIVEVMAKTISNENDLCFFFNNRI